MDVHIALLLGCGVMAGMLAMWLLLKADKKREGGAVAAVSPKTQVPAQPQPRPVAVDPAEPVLRRVFDAASSALVVLSLDGRVHEANRTALDLTGRSRDVVLGADFADVFLIEEQRAEGRQTLRAALKARPGEADPITATAPHGVTGRAGADPSARPGVLWRILPLPGRDGEEAADLVLLSGSLFDDRID